MGWEMEMGVGYDGDGGLMELGLGGDGRDMGDGMRWDGNG